MANQFKTSVNILRDSNSNFNYYPTPNAKKVVSQLVNDFKIGLRAFNIIGTYGTGKSSFLWAFEKSLKEELRFFDTNFIDTADYGFLKLVGTYKSIVEHFAEILEVETSTNIQENIFSEIYNQYYSIKSNKKVLFILIDEFGKYLEYASKNNPENELYFIQQLAEFCNSSNHNIVLITTVHQGFDSYGLGLSRNQQQEWTKVKGRFREITFNEPVEQLLFLASEFLLQNTQSSKNEDLIKTCVELAIKSKVFGVNDIFIRESASKLFPLDVVSAYTVTMALQRYGQNERSLFSFLESTDHTSISKFNKFENPFFNLSNVYDYLSFNFYSFLNSKYNPDFSGWSSVRVAIEKVERTFETNVEDYVKTIKVIGLLNIFTNAGAILDFNFLTRYLKLACGISNSTTILENLQSRKIIRYREHAKKFILFEGTDLDIETAIIEAANKVSEITDLPEKIKKYVDFPPVFAKQYSFKTGTPRYFEFQITDKPISKLPVGEIDGFVNLIFNPDITEQEIAEFSSMQEEATIYCFFKNANEIKSLLFEIEKIQRVIEENSDDLVAKRELENIRDSQKRILKHFISNKGLFSGNDNVSWYFLGEKLAISSKRDFLKLVSRACEQVYSSTPIFINELVNRHKISSSIHTAKKNYLKALTSNWGEDNLGFDELRFPPEKTIYLSLLKENGISSSSNEDRKEIAISETSSFRKTWEASVDFLNRAKQEPLKVSDLYDVLGRRPFKLKLGLLDFWVPTFLFLKKDDFAIFNENVYIPNLTGENLELIPKYPSKYSIKTFDVDGIKLDIFNSYRNFLNQADQIQFTNESFIDTIKPFIIFYKNLPDYSKNTQRLSKSAKSIRNAIVQSKSPEDTFFEAFPRALGFSIDQLTNPESLKEFTFELQTAVRELRTSYESLVDRFEEFICGEVIGSKMTFEVYKPLLQQRYIDLRKHLLLNTQKTFVQRLDSSLEDRKAWLNSLAQAVTGKILESFKDEDEILLYDRFKRMILDLDSLTSISQKDVDDSKEEVMSIKIDSFDQMLEPKVVRIPKGKTEEIEKLKGNLKEVLGEDSTSNIAAVLSLLKDMLK